MDILRSFHLHMISDATGETLITIAKAVRVQYAQVRAIEHLHPLVRSRRELERVVKDVEAAPGIVLYTLFNRELADELEKSCKRLNMPCVPALKPILQVFESYLGTPSTPTVGGPARARRRLFPPHRRAQLHHAARRRPSAGKSQRGRHGPGRHQPHVEDADLDLSRQSRVQDRQCPAGAGRAAAAAARSAGQCLRGGTGGDRGPHLPGPPEPRDRAVASVTWRIMSTARRSPPRSPRRAQLCARHGWPIIDVTRRSIEETAAAIIRLYHDREAPVLEA